MEYTGDYPREVLVRLQVTQKCSLLLILHSRIRQILPIVPEHSKGFPAASLSICHDCYVKSLECFVDEGLDGLVELSLSDGLVEGPVNCIVKGSSRISDLYSMIL